MVKKVAWLLLTNIVALGLGGRTAHMSAQEALAAHHLAPNATRRYLYVFPPGAVDISDIDHNFRLVRRISVPPTTVGVRGAGVHAGSHALYPSFGEDGGRFGTGSLLR